MSAAEPVRIALVGYGRWAPVLLRNWMATPEARVVAVCDRHPERIEAARERWPELEAQVQYASILARTDVDAVVLATPISTHVPLALQALVAGKHVLVEKPMATSSADAAHLVREAAAADRVLMVDHTLLFADEVLAVRAAERIDAVRINAGPVRDDVLWDLAVHDVAVFQHVFERPLRARARRVDGVVHGEVTYARGLGTFQVGWAPERRRGWSVAPPAPVRPSGTEPVARLCAAFVRAIRGEPPVSDGPFALGVTRVLEALESSVRTGREVAL